MAESCKEQQERIEETVLQPIDEWVEQQEERCRNEPCIWWMLCLNKLVCWIAVVLAKVILWVVTVVVRWGYRIVCTAVSLIIGVLALVIGNTAILVQALKDLWELTKDSLYTAIGVVVFAALRIVDVVQSTLGLQPAKRRLSERERGILWPIFRESINYNAIELVIGSAGILSISGRPFTMGYTIYIPSYSDRTLVHECVHTWQFQFEGFEYIGNSALNQLDSMVFNKGYQPYDWQSHIDAGKSWYTLKSAEAQAKFIDTAYEIGHFTFDSKGIPDDVNPGAFFRDSGSAGQNVFMVGTNDYTEEANKAWRIIRTG